MQKPKIRCLYLFIIILVLGACLRLYNLNNIALWQDEAETAWYAKQMADFNLPSAYDSNRDLFLFIGALLPHRNQVQSTGVFNTGMYEFSQEDFTDDGVLIKHPYGDILAAAISFFLFGVSTFSARIMFALSGVLSLILTFKLAAYLYNRRTALIAMTFQALNIVLAGYERQARYYSLSVFCFLGGLYFSLKAVENKQGRDFFFAGLFLVLLLLVNPITAICTVMIIVLYNTHRLRNIKWVFDGKLLLCIFFISCFVVLYSMVYQPWRAWNITPVNYPFSMKFFKVCFFLLRFYMDSAFIPVCFGTLILLLRRKQSDIFILLVFAVCMFVYPYIIIYSSLYERLMLVLVPFIAITAGLFFNEFYLFLAQKNINTILRSSVFYVTLLSALTVPWLYSFPVNIIAEKVEILQRDIPCRVPLLYYLRLLNGLELDNFLYHRTVDPRWVNGTIEFLKSKNIDESEWVFTTYRNTVFLFYSNLRAQLIWPVRKSFLDSCKKRFWVVIDPWDYKYTTCHWYYKFSGEAGRCGERNYSDVIKNARRYLLPSGAIVYECNW